MYLAEDIKEKWSGVMNHDDLPEISDPYKRDVTLRLLENQEKFLQEAAPTNATAAGAGNMANWDPILISLVRRAMPHLIAYDVAGVQPMSGPTGLIFALKSTYTNQGGAEAGFDEADTDFSGNNAASNTSGAPDHVALTSTTNPFTGTWTRGVGMTTAQGEALGAC